MARAAVGALPAHAVDDCHARLEILLPGQFLQAGSILEVDLANINALMHPHGMVCNAGWIEASGGEFGFYRDGTRQAVAAVIEALDRERLAIADRLEVAAAPFVELFDGLGFTPRGVSPATTVADAIAQSELIHPIQSPPTLDHPYLHEDVAWGLVPWLRLAAAVGCDTPTTDALVQLASVMNGVDYKREGLTLERMGLSGCPRQRSAAPSSVRRRDIRVSHPDFLDRAFATSADQATLRLLEIGIAADEQNAPVTPAVYPHSCRVSPRRRRRAARRRSPQTRNHGSHR
ncbi:MAG: NAD/NADP octopine/nopaline dehydrogenase family protein [Actinobacteria bacterium]|nr:NAD/NADP octopine/nopaline dehydrogenase family protein [Actinomycetota bacterium]